MHGGTMPKKFFSNFGLPQIMKNESMLWIEENSKDYREKFVTKLDSSKLQVVFHFDFLLSIEVIYIVLLFTFTLFSIFSLLVPFVYMNLLSDFYSWDTFSLL